MMNKDQLGRLTTCITAVVLISISTRGVSAQTPTPPPACPLGEVSVLPSVVYYTNSYGEFLLFAEYCNATSKSVGSVEAQLRFYNVTNEEIETYPRPNLPRSDGIYAPNARWCVGYLLPVTPLNMARVKVDAPTYKIVDHAQASVGLLDVTVNITDHVILGRVRNDHPAGIQGLDMRATLYDNLGRVIGCSAPGINNRDLDSRQATTFRASFPGYGKVTDDLYKNYAGYHLWADALTIDKLPIHLPQVIQQYAPSPTPTPTSVPTATPVITPGPPSLVGNRNILRINVNPINSGGTVYATWSIPNFRDGEFDKGDGAGFKGPIAGTMTVDVPNITASRYITLRWRDTSGQELEDKLIVYVSGQSGPTPTLVNRGACNSSDPNWRGGTPAYTFCVARDLNWTDGGKEIRYFFTGQDFTLTASWDIYGIAGLWFIVGSSSQVCGPAGTVTINRQTVGTGQESFNIRDLPYGGYKVHLRVKRSSDGVEVDYNEKFLCIGYGQETPVPTTTPIVTPLPMGD